MIYLDKVENSFVDTGFEFEVSMEEIRFERGLARFDIDSLKLAFDDFTFCIDKNFEKPTSFHCRGIIYVAHGMYPEGCADLKKARQLGGTDAQEMIEKYCK